MNKNNNNLNNLDRHIKKLSEESVQKMKFREQLMKKSRNILNMSQIPEHIRPYLSANLLHEMQSKGGVRHSHIGPLPLKNRNKRVMNNMQNNRKNKVEKTREDLLRLQNNKYKIDNLREGKRVDNNTVKNLKNEFRVLLDNYYVLNPDVMNGSDTKELYLSLYNGLSSGLDESTYNILPNE